MGTVLALAIHNHQPVGNFPHVFEAAYAQSYLPMLRALERHPAVRVAMHYSGPLLDWIESAHPEFLSMLRGLVERGQVEMMTGGYDEPILAVIPERDRAGQIRKMTTYLHRRLGARPKGLWLAERVWEPHLARSIAAAGVEYTIVDDAHFLAAGMRAEDLTGYFVTEEEGLTLKVFPSLRALRYMIPWKSVEEVLAFLRDHARDPSPVLLMGDDGEKFGLWPGTYAHCWEQGWMEAFFSALEAAGDRLTVAPPGEASAGPAAGRVYLPTASYDEMEEWALPVESGVEYRTARRRLEEQHDPALRYLRGGFWRQFLVKYPEINTMHKKMLRVSEKVWALPPGRRRQRALDELWQGQCNCPYWHGVFGGVYLPHIRRANFAHLIAAEAIADRTRKALPAAVALDLDGDGAAEIEIATPSMVLWIDPARGGGIIEWDWRRARVNLANVLTRREEAYHRQLIEVRPEERGPDAGLETIHTTQPRVKEPGLDRLLVYDRYRRASFLDHVLPSGATLERFAAGEIAPGFAGLPYTVDLPRPRSAAQVFLTREVSPVRIEKRFSADGASDRLHVAYRVTNTGPGSLRACFGVETSWAVTDPESPVRIDGTSQAARDHTVLEAAQRIELTDYGWPAPVVLTFPQAAVWRFPIDTVSNSEAGFERTFQGVTCVCVWPLELGPGEAREFTFECLAG